MAKWGKVDFSDLKKLQKNLERMQADMDKINIACIKELAARVLRKAIQNTPVDTGVLRSEWAVDNVWREGNYYFVEVYNPMDYAPYVEYGHRKVNKNGQTIGWVQGHFMLKVACEEVERLAPKIIEKRLSKELGVLFK